MFRPTYNMITRRQLLGSTLSGAAVAALLQGCAPPASQQGFAALVLDIGGPDDHSFNAGAVKGLTEAQQQLALPAGATKYVESHNSGDYQTNLTTLASQNFKVIFAVGYAMAGALNQVAPRFPKVKFAIVDDQSPPFPNCEGLVFKEQEGSFLAGYLAGMVSKTKKIGFVGGQRIPLIERFEAGYRAGAETADPSIVVTATYTGDWNDESKGRSQAEQQFGAGDDIIYQAAGKAGLGVIEAAKARGKGFYAIGVDMDQDYLAPGSVLTSMVKHVDTAVLDTIKRVKDGQFDAGTHVYGLKDGAVGLSPMKYTRQDVPAVVFKKLDELKAMIIAGKLVPPSKLSELNAFHPPHIA